MKKRIWGLFEAVCFYAAYCASGFIAELCAIIFYAVYFAIISNRGNEIFNATEFLNDISSATESSKILILFLSHIIILALYAVIIYARGGKFKKYMALERASVISAVSAGIAGWGLWRLSTIIISELFINTAAISEYSNHIQSILGDGIGIGMVVTVLSAPIVEELIFRGALFRSIERVCNKWVAVLATALLFAIAHINPIHMCYAFVLGILIGMVRAKTLSLIPCIALHLVYNLANYVEIDEVLPLWLVISMTVIFYFLSLHKKDCQH